MDPFICEPSPCLAGRSRQQKPAHTQFPAETFLFSGLLGFLPLESPGTMPFIVSASGRESVGVCPGALLAALRFSLSTTSQGLGLAPFVLLSLSRLFSSMSLCFVLSLGGPLQCPRPSLIHHLLFIWDFHPIQPRSTSRIYQIRLSGPFNLAQSAVIMSSPGC